MSKEPVDINPIPEKGSVHPSPKSPVARLFNVLSPRGKSTPQLIVFAVLFCLIGGVTLAASFAFFAEAPDVHLQANGQHPDLVITQGTGVTLRYTADGHGQTLTSCKLNGDPVTLSSTTDKSAVMGASTIAAASQKTPKLPSNLDSPSTTDSAPSPAEKTAPQPAPTSSQASSQIAAPVETAKSTTGTIDLGSGLPAGNYTYKIECVDAQNNSGSDTVKVTVNPLPPTGHPPGLPVLTLSSNSPVTTGTPVTLNYTARVDGGLIKSCVFDPSSIALNPSTYPTSTSTPYSGQTAIGALATGTYTYTLSCTSTDEQSAKATTTVVVSPAPPPPPPPTVSSDPVVTLTASSGSVITQHNLVINEGSEAILDFTIDTKGRPINNCTLNNQSVNSVLQPVLSSGIYKGTKILNDQDLKVSGNGSTSVYTYSLDCSTIGGGTGSDKAQISVNRDTSSRLKPKVYMNINGQHPRDSSLSIKPGDDLKIGYSVNPNGNRLLECHLNSGLPMHIDVTKANPPYNSVLSGSTTINAPPVRPESYHYSFSCSTAVGEDTDRMAVDYSDYRPIVVLKANERQNLSINQGENVSLEYWLNGKGRTITHCVLNQDGEKIADIKIEAESYYPSKEKKDKDPYNIGNDLDSRDKPYKFGLVCFSDAGGSYDTVLVTVVNHAEEVVSRSVEFAWTAERGCSSKDVYQRTERNMSYTGQSCYTNSSILGIDCGAFVTAVMRTTIDPNYNDRNEYSGGQKLYLDRHPEKYDYIGQGLSNVDKQFKSGYVYIGVNNGHTYIYLGPTQHIAKKYDAKWNTDSVSASRGTRAPSGSTFYPSNGSGGFYWYRVK